MPTSKNPIPNPAVDPPRGTRTVVIVGEGNIGSFLTPLIARSSAVGELIAIDGDRYDESNLVGQNITAAVLGQSKALVQAEAARALGRDDLAVEAFDRWFEHVPFGRIAAADLVIGAVDSKAARQTISEAAFRAGVPYLDTGVNTRQATARVSFFDPRIDSSCIECRWSDDDYADLKARQPCLELARKNGTANTEATAGPAWLGSLTASIAAGMAIRILEGEIDVEPAEVVVEPYSMQSIRGTLQRNPNCRFDHQALQRTLLPRSPAELTLSQALVLCAGGDGRVAVEIGLLDLPWGTEARCDTCAGSPRRSLSLAGRKSPANADCPQCAEAMTPLGYSSRDRLPRSFFSAEELDSPLDSFGFEDGDVITVLRPDEELRHFELPRAAAPRIHNQPITQAS